MTKKLIEDILFQFKHAIVPKLSTTSSQSKSKIMEQHLKGNGCKKQLNHGETTHTDHTDGHSDWVDQAKKTKKLK